MNSCGETNAYQNMNRIDQMVRCVAVRQWNMHSKVLKLHRISVRAADNNVRAVRAYNLDTWLYAGGIFGPNRYGPDPLSATLLDQLRERDRLSQVVDAMPAV